MKKRKITSVFLALGLFASLLFQVPISAEEADQSAAVEASGTISTNSISGWPQASDISSEAAVVMENTTNTILYSKNADEVLFPGSTVKIMTCFLALENTQLTDEVTMTATGVSGVTDGGASTSSQADEVFIVAQCRACRRFCGRLCPADEYQGTGAWMYQYRIHESHRTSG